MESLRRLSTPCTAVFITTDKVYLNKEWSYSYRESDPLGGHDPYSSSKAAAELAIASWRLSYFHHQHPTINIVSAISGNVIGGGDWSPDRLIPDIIRSLINQRDIVIRHPNSTRPWQHVLDPLAGYILLAESLNSSPLNHSSYNFGPSSEGNRTVSDLVQEVFRTWPGSWFVDEPPDTMHEANLLNLATDLAHHDLSWFPRWGFSESIFRTTNWYKQVCSNSLSPFEACMIDLTDYLSHS